MMLHHPSIGGCPRGGARDRLRNVMCSQCGSSRRHNVRCGDHVASRQGGRNHLEAASELTDLADERAQIADARGSSHVDGTHTRGTPTGDDTAPPPDLLPTRA